MILRKSFGQVFLRDEEILKRIAKFSDEGDTVLEIGAGDGRLTKYLKGYVFVVEKDKRFAEELRKNYIVFEGDILKISFKEIYENIRILLGDRKIKVISNLPYYISSDFILKCIYEIEFLESVHIMLQKEFCEKLMAEPKSNNYSALSQITQVFFDIKKEFDVSPHSFFPKPKVWSSFVSLIPKSVDIKNRRKFINFVFSIFKRKRRFVKIGRKKFERAFEITPQKVVEIYKTEIEKEN